MANTTDLSPACADIPALLEGLIIWLNANLPVNPAKPLTTQDVAHLTLTAAEFEQIPGKATWCAWRRVWFKAALGFEIWRTGYALQPVTELAGLRGRIAWKLTGNTAALFH